MQCLFRHWFPGHKLTLGGSTACLLYSDVSLRERCLAPVINMSLAKNVNASLTHVAMAPTTLSARLSSVLEGGCLLHHQPASDHGDGGSSCTRRRQTTQHECRNEGFLYAAHWRTAEFYLREINRLMWIMWPDKPVVTETRDARALCSLRVSEKLAHDIPIKKPDGYHPAAEVLNQYCLDEFFEFGKNM